MMKIPFKKIFLFLFSIFVLLMLHHRLDRDGYLGGFDEFQMTAPVIDCKNGFECERRICTKEVECLKISKFNIPKGIVLEKGPADSGGIAFVSLVSAPKNIEIFGNKRKPSQVNMELKAEKWETLGKIMLRYTALRKLREKISYSEDLYRIPPQREGPFQDDYFLHKESERFLNCTTPRKDANGLDVEVLCTGFALFNDSLILEYEFPRSNISDWLEIEKNAINTISKYIRQ